MDTQLIHSNVILYARFLHSGYTHILILQLLFHSYDFVIQMTDFGQLYDSADQTFDLVLDVFVIGEACLNEQP